MTKMTILDSGNCFSSCLL